MAAAFSVAVFLGLDLSRAPGRQWSARALLWTLDVYQATLSPQLSSAGIRCRFNPSCSHFAEGAIRRQGALVGSARAAWRVVRCGPWTAMGTEDPP